MKARKRCKCGYHYKWTESQYANWHWTCKGCGKINSYWSLWEFLKEKRKKYEYCPKCKKLIKGMKISHGSGWRDFGFKCSCGHKWIIGWTEGY